MPCSLLSFQSLGNSAGLNGFVFCQQRLLLSILHNGITLRRTPRWGLRQIPGSGLYALLGPPQGGAGGPVPKHTPERACSHHDSPKEKAPPPTFSLFPPLRNKTKKPSHWHSSENSSIFCSFPVQNKQQHKI